MAIIIPDKDHSRVATYQLNSFILNKLKEKESSLRKVTFRSDWYSSQFLSRHVFLDLTDLDRDITELEWNYFDSNHTKYVVGSIGGCVKKVFKHVRSFKVVLSNVEEFASYTNKVVEGIDIIYHDTSKILYTLKEALTIQVAGTWKVWMIQHSIGTN